MVVCNGSMVTLTPIRPLEVRRPCALCSNSQLIDNSSVLVELLVCVAPRGCNAGDCFKGKSDLREDNIMPSAEQCFHLHNAYSES